MSHHNATTTTTITAVTRTNTSDRTNGRTEQSQGSIFHLLRTSCAGFRTTCARRLVGGVVAGLPAQRCRIPGSVGVGGYLVFGAARLTDSTVARASDSAAFDCPANRCLPFCAPRPGRAKRARAPARVYTIYYTDTDTHTHTHHVQIQLKHRLAQWGVCGWGFWLCGRCSSGPSDTRDCVRSVQSTY